MILILNSKATTEQIAEVTKLYECYTKVVVDIKRGVLAAGGEYHIDCEKPYSIAGAYKTIYGEEAIGLTRTKLILWH